MTGGGGVRSEKSGTSNVNSAKVYKDTKEKHSYTFHSYYLVFAHTT